MRLWRQSSSRLVECVWVHECQWFVTSCILNFWGGLMSHHRRSPFTVSLYRLRGQPCPLLPASSTPYSGWRGIQWSSILWHVPPIAAGPLWVWRQCWYTLQGPEPREGLHVDYIKGLCQIYKDRVLVEGLVLCNARLLHLSDDNYFVHVAASSSEATLFLWETSFGDCDQSVRENAGKDLPLYGKEWDAPVVYTVRLAPLFLVESNNKNIAKVFRHVR